MKRLFSLLLIISILFSVSAAFATDPVQVKKITLDKTSVNIPINKSVTVKATVDPKNAKNKKITWTTSDKKIATVNNGQIKGVGIGTAVITATAADGSGVSASVKVRVVKPVKKITLSETKTLNLAPWVPWRLTAVVEPYEASIMDVKWSTSDKKVATVDKNGVVKGVAPGTAKITATAADGSNVKAVVNVKVSEYDLVFIDRTPKTVTYSYGSGYILVKGSVKTGCVKIPNIDTSILALIGGDARKETVSVTPVKPGADVVTITAGKNKFVYNVFVSPEAFPTSKVAPPNSEKKKGKSEDLLFMNVPWGSSYNESNKSLQNQGKKLKSLAQYNNVLRAMVDGEVSFSDLTAFRAAMNFTYDKEDKDFKKNNSFYKGDFYFDPDIPFERIQLAVRNEYDLDKGSTSGKTCTWKKGNVKLVLTKKENFTILEITKDSGKK